MTAKRLFRNLKYLNIFNTLPKIFFLKKWKVNRTAQSSAFEWRQSKLCYPYSSKLDHQIRARSLRVRKNSAHFLASVFQPAIGAAASIQSKIFYLSHCKHWVCDFKRITFTDKSCNRKFRKGVENNTAFSDKKMQL